MFIRITRSSGFLLSVGCGTLPPERAENMGFDACNAEIVLPQRPDYVPTGGPALAGAGAEPGACARAACAPAEASRAACTARAALDWARS